MEKYLNLKLHSRWIITGILCFDGCNRYQSLPPIIKSRLVLAQTNAESERSLNKCKSHHPSDRSALGEATITGLHTVKEAARFHDPVNGQPKSIGITKELKQDIFRIIRKDHMEKQALKVQQVREKKGLPQPQMTCSEPLPAVADKPASLPTVNFPAPFTHSFPENTSSEANVIGTSAPRLAVQVSALQQPVPLPIQPAPLPQMPMLPSYSVFIMPSNKGGAAIITPQSHPQVELQQQSRSQYYYNKRKREKELSGVKSRKYTRSANPIICGKCGQPREQKLHQQYFGNWYCKTTEAVSFEEWRDNLKSKGYGKKKIEK